MSKHTPGPWTFHAMLSASENHRGYWIKDSQEYPWTLAIVQPGDQDGNMGEANARIICAALDLLFALKAVRAANPMMGADLGAMVDAAILKATNGGQA